MKATPSEVADCMQKNAPYYQSSWCDWSLNNSLRNISKTFQRCCHTRKKSKFFITQTHNEKQKLSIFIIHDLFDTRDEICRIVSIDCGYRAFEVAFRWFDIDLFRDQISACWEEYASVSTKKICPSQGKRVSELWNYLSCHKLYRKPKFIGRFLWRVNCQMT